jgi:hypothetical protein
MLPAGQPFNLVSLTQVSWARGQEGGLAPARLREHRPASQL